MAKQIELEISPRTVTGKATKQLRKAGIIPANIFGHGEESQSVQVAAAAYSVLHRSRQTSGVISLKIAGEKKRETVLIRQIKHDPITDKIIHIDFLRVNLKDRIISKLALHFIGVAPGVKVEGGVLVHLTDTLEVECEAGDRVEAIEVDIATLEHIDESIHARDVKLPDNYTLITDPDETIVKIIQPRIEEVKEASETPAPASESPKA